MGGLITIGTAGFGARGTPPAREGRPLESWAVSIPGFPVGLMLRGPGADASDGDTRDSSGGGGLEVSMCATKSAGTPEGAGRAGSPPGGGARTPVMGAVTGM